MKNIFYIGSLLLLASLAACNKGEGVVPDKYASTLLPITSSNLRFDYRGNQKGTIVVPTSAKITATIRFEEGVTPWCFVDQIEGNTVHVSVDANDGALSRSTYVVVEAGGLKRDVPVTQTALAFSTETKVVDFTAAGGSKTISMTVPDGFTATAAPVENWITATVNNDNTVTITTTANNNDARTGSVVLSVGVVKSTLTITQGDNFVISTEALQLAAAAGTKNVNFSFNGTAIPVTYTLDPVVAGITVSVNETTRVLTITTTDNTAGFAHRKTNINVTAGTATRIIPVDQLGNGTPTVADIVGAYSGTFVDLNGLKGTFGSVNITAATDPTKVTMSMTMLPGYISPHVGGLPLQNMPPFDLTMNVAENTLSFEHNTPANSNFTLILGSQTLSWRTFLQSPNERSPIVISITNPGELKSGKGNEWGFRAPEAGLPDGSVANFPLIYFRDVNLTRQ